MFANLWYMSCYALCLAGWIVILLRWLHGRSPAEAWFLCLFSGFSLISLSMSLGTAQSAAGAELFRPLNVISLLAISLHLLSLPRFVRCFLVHRGQTALIRVSTMLALTSTAMPLVVFFPDNPLVFWGIFVPHLGIFGLVMAYVLVALRLIDRHHRLGPAVANNRLPLAPVWSHFFGPAFWCTSACFPLIAACDILQLPRLILGQDLPRLMPMLAAVLSLSYLRAIYLSQSWPLAADAGSARPPAARINLDGFGLSPRETEVAALLLEGLSYQDIAVRLFISPGTVKTHVLKVYQKAGVRSKIALLHAIQARNRPENASTKR